MVVVRLPHVDVRGARGEQIIVCAYVEIVAAEIVVAAYLADPLPPFRLARGLAHDDVRRQVDVLGELRRRDAAGVKPSQHGGAHCGASSYVQTWCKDTKNSRCVTHLQRLFLLNA